MKNMSRKRQNKPLSESESEPEFSEQETKRYIPKPQSSTPATVKRSNVYLRTVSTLILLTIITLVISMGHFYCVLFILALLAGIFHEIINLKRNYLREEPIQFSTRFNWYFFFVCIAFTLVKYFKDMLADSPNILIQMVLDYKKTLFFSLYMAGFLVYVISLKKGFYRYQIRLFFWTHIVLVLVLGVSASISVVYHGLIWFLASILLVTANDIFAYIFGKLFGKRPLISLSPNKTVEGFIGGMGATIFFAWVVN